MFPDIAWCTFPKSPSSHLKNNCNCVYKQVVSEPPGGLVVELSRYNILTQMLLTCQIALKRISILFWKYFIRAIFRYCQAGYRDICWWSQAGEWNIEGGAEGGGEAAAVAAGVVGRGIAGGVGAVGATDGEEELLDIEVWGSSLLVVLINSAESAAGITTWLSVSSVEASPNALLVGSVEAAPSLAWWALALSRFFCLQAVPLHLLLGCSGWKGGGWCS